MAWLLDGENILKICLFVLTESMNVTDGHTRTPHDGIGRAYLILDFGVSIRSVLRTLESSAQCTSPLQPKVTRTFLWLLRTAKE